MQQRADRRLPGRADRAGLLGYFVIIRQNAFAAHALAHIGFPGATGAILVGAPVTLGPGGVLHRRRAADRRARQAGRPTARSPPARSSRFATGLGVLFASLASANASTTTTCCSATCWRSRSDQLVVFAVFTVGRRRRRSPSSRGRCCSPRIDPEVAEARGVPVRALGLASSSCWR